MLYLLIELRPLPSLGKKRAQTLELSRRVKKALVSQGGPNVLGHRLQRRRGGAVGHGVADSGNIEPVAQGNLLNTIQRLHETYAVIDGKAVKIQSQSKT